MKKIYLFTFIFSMLILLAHADDDDASKEKSAETKSTQTAPAKPAKKNVKPLKEFVPSEEISVDRAVAFPVDI